MTGREFKRGRLALGLTQKEAAARLGLSQPYVALLEAEKRPLPPRLAKKAVRLLKLSPVLLPLSTTAGSPAEGGFEQDLGALGYPGYAYLRKGKKRNPAEFVLTALAQANLPARVVEALPWLLLHYPEMNHAWLLEQARLRNLQNRLGFVVNLARRVADKNADKNEGLRQNAEAGLSALENELAASRLAREDTLCQANLLPAEKTWLLQNRPPEAEHWNLLTDWKPEFVRYASRNPVA